MPILATPDNDVAIPFHHIDGTPDDIRELAERAFNTLTFLEENGLEIPIPKEISQADKRAARAEFMESTAADKDFRSPGKVRHLKKLVDAYDAEIVRTAAQIRNYVKLRLLELTDSPKEATQLRALELLGKMSDVSAFAENMNVNVTHRTKEDLDKELADKLGRYIKDVTDAEVIPQSDDSLLLKAPSPVTIDVDKELDGVLSDAE